MVGRGRGREEKGMGTEVGFSPFQANLLQRCVMKQLQESVPSRLQFFQRLQWIVCDPFLHT